MKSFAAVASLGAFASATMMQKIDYDFMRYISTYNKMYATVEEFNLRQQNYAAVEEHIQSSNANSDSSYRAGHNLFSDWTVEEKERLLGLKKMTKPDLAQTVTNVDISNLPPAYNHCDAGHCTAVKD